MKAKHIEWIQKQVSGNFTLVYLYTGVQRKSFTLTAECILSAVARKKPEALFDLQGAILFHVWKHKLSAEYLTSPLCCCDHSTKYLFMPGELFYSLLYI